MRISMKETIAMNGFCPTVNTETRIKVTYKKITMLGDPNEYATICNIDCPDMEECPDVLKCPVALQRIYW